jgi:hypothetical protein
MNKAKPDPIFEVDDFKLRSLGASNYSLSLSGRLLGRPRQRLIIGSASVKITAAKISRSQKNKQFDYQVNRINRLPTKQQTRLHTTAALYPGHYDIELHFESTSPLELARLPFKLL